ncbi:hypothetical protein [Bacilliculturomica massiliensis]|uniref:hypothetical protein n=1 Tax=Bacilliculturomica massiliensis TaxID=1917867 RepID=UPI00103059F6|nr:hypothetical protein [Bacilliculturomica massiliensis]
MRVGIVGHPVKVSVVEKVISEQEDFPELKKWMLPSTNMESDLEEFKRFQAAADIVIFCGIYDYTSFASSIVFEKVTGYIRNDVSSLYKALLEASLAGYPFSDISIDGYRREEIEEILSELRSDRRKPAVRDYFKTEILDESVIGRITEFHWENVKCHGSQLCVTCMTPVCEELRRRGVRTILVSSTAENIRLEYERLKYEYRLKQKGIRDIAMIDIEIRNSEQSVIFEDDYATALENMQIMEKVYLFAQKMQGAVEEMNLTRYLIVTNKSALEKETGVFREIRLLADAHRFSNLKLFMGIGFGNTAREARSNARVGLSRAKTCDRSCAFVIYDHLSVQGPLEYRKGAPENRTDDMYIKIAEKTSLSINTVRRLMEIENRHRGDSFTVAELANLYGVSEKSMYRIVDKLDAQGYIAEEGRRIKDNFGRPSRIIKLKLDLDEN